MVKKTLLLVALLIGAISVAPAYAAFGDVDINDGVYVTTVSVSSSAWQVSNEPSEVVGVVLASVPAANVECGIFFDSATIESGKTSGATEGSGSYPGLANEKFRITVTSTSLVFSEGSTSVGVSPNLDGRDVSFKYPRRFKQGIQFKFTYFGHAAGKKAAILWRKTRGK